MKLIEASLFLFLSWPHKNLVYETQLNFWIHIILCININRD